MRPQNPPASPDYGQLVRFLVEPFLESPESLRVDCERSSILRRTWIRLAFEAEDKGRVYGRGGRNIHSIRMVLAAMAKAAGESIYLDIYDSQPDEQPRETFSSRPPARRPSGQTRPSRSDISKPRLPRRDEQ